MCNDIPESIIFLSCGHIICLVCAARMIIGESEENELNFSEVICGVCQQSTQLTDEV